MFSGAYYGPWAPPFVNFLPVPEDPVGEGLGHFLGAMRVDAWRPADEFKSHMDNWISRFRDTKAMEGKKVLIPGDPEREFETERMENGIPLNEKVVADLNELANKFKVDTID
mgnify:FL=1